MPKQTKGNSWLPQKPTNNFDFKRNQTSFSRNPILDMRSGPTGLDSVIGATKSSFDTTMMKTGAGAVGLAFDVGQIGSLTKTALVLFGKPYDDFGMVALRKSQLEQVQAVHAWLPEGQKVILAISEDPKHAQVGIYESLDEAWGSSFPKQSTWFVPIVGEKKEAPPSAESKVDVMDMLDRLRQRNSEKLKGFSPTRMYESCSFDSPGSHVDREAPFIDRNHSEHDGGDPLP